MKKIIALSLFLALILVGCDVQSPTAPEAVAPSQQSMDIDNPQVTVPSVSSDASASKASGISQVSLAGCDIAYDMSHDTGRQNNTSPTGLNNNSTIFGDYTSRGATISVINTFDLPTLSQFNVLWLEEDFNTPLSAAEKADLSSFVSGGGSVFICCEDWAILSGDPGSPLGVFGLGYTTPGISGLTTNVTPHPITAGVTTVAFPGSVRSLTVGAATSLVQDATGTLDGFAVLGFGAGTVVAFSDELFTDATVTSADNRVLGNNMMDFVCVIEVDIDIKPGNFPNSINTKSKGNIPVAVLGSATFDVNDIDRTTLAFGPGGATPAHTDLGHLEDVNGDGFMDLVSHYPTQDTGLALGDTDACVTGSTTGGQAFQGCDSVNIVK